MKFLGKLAAMSVLIASGLMTACGTDQDISRFHNDAEATAASDFRVAIFEAPSGSGQFLILANALQSINSGSFQYCLGEAQACQNTDSRTDLLPANMTNVPASAHRLPGTHTITTSLRLNLYATLSDGKAIQGAFRFVDRATGAEQTVAGLKNISHDAARLLAGQHNLTGIDYDYEYGKTAINAGNPHIRVKLTNQELLAKKDTLGVVIAGHALKNTGKPVSSNTAVKVEADGSVIVSGEGFEPETVYRVYLYFYDLSNESSPRLLGSFKHPYYFVTEGTTKQINKSRARIAMRSLAEFYDWELGRYDSSKGYTNHPGYGWCHLFYSWSVKEQLTTTYDHAYYNPSDWQKHNSYYTNPNEVLTKVQNDVIHGDFIRLDGHSAMLLAYDEHTRQLWTIEGNFNNRVVVWKRPVSGFWYGHLVDGMIKQ